MKTKRITIATIKSFIKKNNDKLLINVKSKFDGMTDGLEDKKDGFTKAVINLEHVNTENTLGVEKAWFVGFSRDWFEAFENETLIGYQVTNSCGRFILAIAK